MLEKLLEQLHIKKFNKHEMLQSEKQRQIKAEFSLNFSQRNEFKDN